MSPRRPARSDVRLVTFVAYFSGYSPDPTRPMQVKMVPYRNIVAADNHAPPGSSSFCFFQTRALQPWQSDYDAWDTERLNQSSQHHPVSRR